MVNNRTHRDIECIKWKWVIWLVHSRSADDFVRYEIRYERSEEWTRKYEIDNAMRTQSLYLSSAIYWKWSELLSEAAISSQHNNSFLFMYNSLMYS